MSLYRSAADRREQSQQREQGPPPHQVGSRLGPHSDHCTNRSASGYIWVTAWLPASGMGLNLRSMPKEVLLLVFKSQSWCWSVCGSPYEHCAYGKGSDFESPSVSQTWISALIQMLTSLSYYHCLMWTSLLGHCLMKLTAQSLLSQRRTSWSRRTVADMKFTPASFCASGCRTGYQFRQRIAAERRQRGSSQQQGANGSGQASAGICGRQQCHFSSKLSQVALWITQRR
jgi:hypothetical protein